MTSTRLRKRRRIPFGPILLIVAGLILIVSMIWQLLLRTTAAPAATSPVSPQEITRISIDEAREAVDAGQAFFIDVRAEDFFVREHIPGALNIPLDQIEYQLSVLNPDHWYIPYCT